MARRFTRTRGRLGAQRRESTWLSGATDLTTLSVASTAILTGTLNAAALALRPFTIVRTRGIFSIISDQQAANESYSGSYGMAVVSSQATAVGVSAIPTPETDRASDLWFLHESFQQEYSFLDATGAADHQADVVRFDSKAMRKVDTGEDVVVVVESSAISFGLFFTEAFRMLVKLH